ncbi:MAG: thylakoid-associated protein, partial [Cyanobacteria bacterium J06626_26]
YWGHCPSNGEPRRLGVLGASENVYALDQAMVDVLQVDASQIPTVAASQRLGLCPGSIEFVLQSPSELCIDNWQLPEKLMPIDFGMPRVMKSTFKHLYIRFIKEPMAAYAQR